MNSPMYETDQRTGGARAASAAHAWLWAIVTLGYLLPWAIAASRGVRNSGGIFWLNLLTGWTFIGWFVALVMAVQRHRIVPAPVFVQPASAARYATCRHCGQPISFADGVGWGHPHSQSDRCDEPAMTRAEPAPA